MPSSQETRDLVPALEVLVDGSRLPSSAAADLIGASVYEELDAPSMFTLRLANWDMRDMRITWSDSNLLDEGGVVEIQMGYVDQLRRLIVGEITGLEPEFRTGELPLLTVRGYDRRHRLLRGRKTRTFRQIKDSEIARQIAGDLGLSAEVEDTGATLEYVLQHNQTDMEFLQERARRIGYEVTIDDKTLQYRPMQHGATPEASLAWEADLLEFHPRLSTLGQVSQTVVKGWSPGEKAGLMAEAASGSERTTMEGRTSGPKATELAFGAARGISVDRPVFSQADAQRQAQARFERMALTYVSGDGVCVGRTDLRAGRTVELTGLGKRFSGAYYVVSATHTYSPTAGYRTAFAVRRNAS